MSTQHKSAPNRAQELSPANDNVRRLEQALGKATALWDANTRVLQAALRKHELKELEELGCLPPVAEEPAKLHPLEWMNTKHAVVFTGGKTVILTEWGVTDEQAPSRVTFGSERDLLSFHKNRPAIHPRKGHEVSLGEAWMAWSKRRSYTGLVFRPDNRAPKSAYNLWHGFQKLRVRANATCELFRNHLHNIVCDGDNESYRWLLGWMAHLIQRPQEKPGTAVVLKGAKGAGKDIVGHYLGALFPRNYAKVSQADQLTGRFNAHMEQALLLHVEEGHWAGDRKAEGNLKSLITSPLIAIERKGIDVIQVDSFMRLLITSNEEWVVPATPGERRFFVLNVSPEKAKQKEYFDPLWAELKDGGPAVLFDFLMDYDIMDFDVRNPPETEGLRDQKLATLRGVDAWWRDVLLDGELPGTRDFVDWTWKGGAMTVACDMLHEACADWLHRRRFQGDVPTNAAFGIRLRELVPTVERKQRRDGDRRQWVYVIPHLGECRDALDDVMGSPIEWKG
jgi:hypothetical protein